MTDAPKRIWAAECRKTYSTVWWPDDGGGGGTEYIRADLHEELIKAADKLADAVSNCVTEDGCDYTMEMATKLDLSYSAYRKAKEKLRL